MQLASSLAVHAAQSYACGSLMCMGLTRSLAVQYWLGQYPELTQHSCKGRETSNSRVRRLVDCYSCCLWVTTNHAYSRRIVGALAAACCQSCMQQDKECRSQVCGRWGAWVGWGHLHQGRATARPHAACACGSVACWAGVQEPCACVERQRVCAVFAVLAVMQCACALRRLSARRMTPGTT